MSEPKKPYEKKSATKRYNSDGVPRDLIEALEAAHAQKLTDGDGETVTHSHLQQVARRAGNS